MPAENQPSVKQRAARIPLDYFRRKSLLERGKVWLAIAAAVLAAGYVAWGAVGGGDFQRRYSPGPLSAVHAMWESRCDACHQSFVPTSADAWRGEPHASNQLCQACHQGAVHSANQIAAEVGSCASCHREHQGRDADLIHMADATCTTCHANMAAHLQAGAKPVEPPLHDVTDFVTGHPDFRSTKRSGSEIKFSHSRHMRPGLTFGLGPLLLKDLSPADRERYRRSGQTDTEFVKLDCASCHQLDAGANTAAADDLPVRPAGDYMLPVRFDVHCKACHQLSYVGRMKVSESASEVPRFETVKPGEAIPHGWSGEALRRYVEQVLDMRFIQGADRDLLTNPLGDAGKQPLENWRLPNRRPKTETPPGTIGDYLKDELQAAVKNMELQCVECHTMAQPPESLEVQKVNSHPAWFAMAKFDHAAHRAVSCISCHAGAQPAELPQEPTALKTLDSNVMIPDRAVCLECHSPTGGSGPAAKGGARFDCVECHDYHNSSEPWHGKGATARGAVHRLTPNQFINGDVRPNRE